MILFPKFIVVGLVLGALGLTAVALVALIVMIIKDYISKNIW